MKLQCSVKKTGTRTPRAVLFKCRNAGFDYLRVDGKTEVVVGTKHNSAFVFHNNLGILPGLKSVKIGINALLL